jgi:hypothetical protein
MHRHLRPGQRRLVKTITTPRLPFCQANQCWNFIQHSLCFVSSTLDPPTSSDDSLAHHLPPGLSRLLPDPTVAWLLCVRLTWQTVDRFLKLYAFNPSILRVSLKARGPRNRFVERNRDRRGLGTLSGRLGRCWNPSFPEGPHHSGPLVSLAGLRYGRAGSWPGGSRGVCT